MWCLNTLGDRRSHYVGIVLLTTILASPAGWGAEWGIGFAPPFSFALSGSVPSDMTVADFNGDGHQDIAVAMSGTDSGEGEVSIMLGDGRGLFHNESFTVAFSPRGIASGDFNGDGRIDLALAAGNRGSTSVHILLGDGSGRYSARGGTAKPFSTSRALDFPIAVAAADLDGDGVLDLVVASSGNPHGLTLHYGRGDGKFDDGIAVAEAGSLTVLDVETADLNGDGRPDLVVPQAAFINRGGGNGARSAALGGNQAVALGDLDGDGTTDIVALDASELKVWNGEGEGRFRLASLTTLTGRPRCVRLGDFNRDGLLDVAISNSAAGQVEVLPGIGYGLFGHGRSFAVGAEPMPLVIGDWNEDQLPDIAVAERNRGAQPYLSVLLQYAGRPLQPALIASLANYPD